MNLINDLSRIPRSLVDELKAAASACIDSAYFVLGAQVSAFEREFADYLGTAHCVTVANGTQALELALRSAGVTFGDEVITVANAGYYSTCAILACNAVPVYADIDISDMTMDAASLENAVTVKTRAVIVTHLYGRIAKDLPAIAALCKRRGIVVVEDCAQAHGASLSGKKAGTFGEYGCFSFYPTKNLGALGDGGAVVTGTVENAERLKKLRQYGWDKKYHVGVPYGTNSRLDEMQAALLRVKLKYLDGWNRERREIAAAYNASVRHAAVIGYPDEAAETYVAHLYILRVTGREKLRRYLTTKGIASDVHYPIPDYKQTPLAARFRDLYLEKTERACSEVITLPCFPGLTKEEMAGIAGTINDWSGT
jgi:dTDP-3-amino-2,3,6-trideoxy-4-keto-D-glucose/dTDP-3-amino-3,4,6-trideoxy-alpha-D-glucose/dTDP-2,6-dideoxy-D-kanosamine transaminase